VLKKSEQLSLVLSVKLRTKIFKEKEEEEMLMSIYEA